MKKRWITLLLVVAMALSLIACGSKATTEDKGEQLVTVEDEETSKTDTAADGSEESAGEDTNVADEWIWPLEETVELEFWIRYNNDRLNDPNELLSLQELEKQTNVHIDWTTVMYNEATEKFGLMIASGDYPDIIDRAGYFYGGKEIGLVEDGVALDLTELIPQYMPNYQALRLSNPEIEKNTKADDGRLLAIYGIKTYHGNIQPAYYYNGLVVREDWLNDLNLETPETIDDWYQVLTVFKNELGVEAPLMIGNTGVDRMNTFLTAWGIVQEFYTPDGKNVTYGVLQPEYREYIETFRQWYAEGLIDQNFVSNQGGTRSPYDYIMTGRAGAGFNQWTWNAEYGYEKGYTDDSDFFLQAVANPVLVEGEQPYYGYRMGELLQPSTSVTVACENVEVALRWIDNLYTEETMWLTTLGPEGEAFSLDEDGKPRPTEYAYELVESGEYQTMSDVISLRYASPTVVSCGLGNQDGFSEYVYGDQNCYKTMDNWKGGTYDLLLPSNISLTAEENATYSSLYTAIKTLVDEMTVKYIMGTESMDTYDSFIQQLYDYGIEECIAIQQAAFDRYNNR